LLPGLHYFGDLAGSAVYALDTSRGLYLFDAPGGPALVDLLGRRFKDLGWQGRRPAGGFLTSADERAPAGLGAPTRAGGCAVVAPRAAVEELRRRCAAGTQVLTADEAEKSGWFDVGVVPLGGRGLAPVAYRVSWAGKTVLFSGRIPVKTTVPESDNLVG